MTDVIRPQFTTLSSCAPFFLENHPVFNKQLNWKDYSLTLLGKLCCEKFPLKFEFKTFQASTSLDPIMAEIVETTSLEVAFFVVVDLRTSKEHIRCPWSLSTRHFIVITLFSLIHLSYKSLFLFETCLVLSPFSFCFEGVSTENPSPL